MSVLHKLNEFFWQSWFIPPPTLTEKNLPDQTGRVCIVTGGYAGVGFEVASILFQHNATVYVAGRSESKGADAIEKITAQHPHSEGKIHFLKVDLADLATIKPAVEEFRRRETKLHWLNNNAGVMRTPTSVRGAQGMNMQFQTNMYGPFLLTKLLLPVLKQTAATEPAGSVRVSWAGSVGTIMVKAHGGIAWTEDMKEVAGESVPDEAYHITKAANYLLGVEFGKRSGKQDGVLHVTYNPGNLNTGLARHVQMDRVLMFIAKMIVNPPIFGAYTELYTGFATQLTLKESQGGWVVPWGRTSRPMRPDILAEARKEKGKAFQTYEWCDKITKEWQ